MHAYEIIPYEDRYQPEFKALNLEWLDLHGLTEQYDLDVLNDPRRYIIHTGGAIFLVQHNGEIIGSAAIINEHDGIFELAKMSVAPTHRGQGVSKLLLERCIEKANELNAVKLILFSSHKLKAALGLYEKYGFRHVPVEDSPFLTADVKMELPLL